MAQYIDTHYRLALLASDRSVSFEEQEAIMANITEMEVPKLKALQPATGAYLNEADANEADFQTSFWGRKNYERLYRVKQEGVPSGLFISRRGVGGEDWDDAGLCKLWAIFMVLCMLRGQMGRWVDCFWPGTPFFPHNYLLNYSSTWTSCQSQLSRRTRLFGPQVPGAIL